jgi:hypothetical protein
MCNYFKIVFIGVLAVTIMSYDALYSQDDLYVKIVSIQGGSNANIRLYTHDYNNSLTSLSDEVIYNQPAGSALIKIEFIDESGNKSVFASGNEVVVENYITSTQVVLEFYFWDGSGSPPSKAHHTSYLTTCPMYDKFIY